MGRHVLHLPHVQKRAPLRHSRMQVRIHHPRADLFFGAEDGDGVETSRTGLQRAAKGDVTIARTESRDDGARPPTPSRA